MGETTRRRQVARALRGRLEEAAARVSAALRKLATAASGQLGRDCYVHAELGRQLLEDLGLEARRVVGYAAWRVGPGDGDVISHSPHTAGHLPPGTMGFPYHAWLDCQGLLLDFTTYQLRAKAQALDAADGGHTAVEWCPDFLLLERDEVRSYEEVAAAFGPGVAYYEARPELETALAGFAVDPNDLKAARLILKFPDILVLGPNNLFEGDA